MNWNSVLKLLKSDYARLVPILGLGCYIASIPHQGYAYPVHLDEWLQWAYANEVIKEGILLGLNDPFTGASPSLGQSFERGFSLLLVFFHQIIGIPWLDMFRYLPPVIFALTIIAVFFLGRKLGFGWEAAFFVCLVPTSTGILGPGFLVPVATGLLFLPVYLLVAFYYTKWWHYVLLVIIGLFLLVMHPVTLLGIYIILVPFILLNLKSNFRHSLILMAAMLIPFLIALAIVPSIWDVLIVPTVKSLLVKHELAVFISLPSLTIEYGYLPIALCLAGIFLLAGKMDRWRYGMVLGVLLLVVILAVYFIYGYGIEMFYYRGLLYTMLMLSIAGGAGLSGLMALKFPVSLIDRLKAPHVLRHAGMALGLVCIAVILLIAIPQRQNASYYRMIDDDDYASFVWIRDNVDASYHKAILDPWKATAFTVITGRYIYDHIEAVAEPKDLIAIEFLKSGCEDTEFLRENGISIVYTREECRNPDLVEIRDNVYLLYPEETP